MKDNCTETTTIGKTYWASIKPSSITNEITIIN